MTSPRCSTAADGKVPLSYPNMDHEIGEGFSNTAMLHYIWHDQIDGTKLAELQTTMISSE